MTKTQTQLKWTKKKKSRWAFFFSANKLRVNKTQCEKHHVKETGAEVSLRCSHWAQASVSAVKLHSFGRSFLLFSHAPLCPWRGPLAGRYSESHIWARGHMSCTQTRLSRESLTRLLHTGAKDTARLNKLDDDWARKRSRKKWQAAGKRE